MTPERSDHRILVVASDALLAALVGQLVEAARYTAAFPAPDEQPDQALLRVKPLAAILIDADNGSSASDLLVSRARKLGVSLMLFGGPDVPRARVAWAKSHSLPIFSLPNQLTALEQALEAIMPDNRRPRLERDRRGTAERRPDGNLVFTDAAGIRWTVYDRRAGDRRNVVDRRFVSDAGEVRHCDVSEVEARVTTLSVLAEQLDRATAE